jgi:hypothetical protein
MIYLQPITFWAIVRDLPGTQTTEIAEHPDGAMKAYEYKGMAGTALMHMPADEGWRVDEILMVPPPMTAAAKRQSVNNEIAQSIGRRKA